MSYQQFVREEGKEIFGSTTACLRRENKNACLREYKNWLHNIFWDNYGIVLDVNKYLDSDVKYMEFISLLMNKA
jgi:hypothetical protein